MALPLARNKRLATLNLGSSTSSSPPSQYSRSFIPVTGPPTRHHWKADWKATHCEYFGCTTWFGIFDRRHHCRKCGNIFCAQHCSNYLRLDQACQFHPDGLLSRGCDKCISDYLTWTRRLDEQSLHKKQSVTPTTVTLSSSFTMAPSTTSPPSQKQPLSSPTTSSSLLKKASFSARNFGIEDVMDLGNEDMATPLTESPSTRQIPINRNNKSKKKNDTAITPITSVPADWQWSTF